MAAGSIDLLFAGWELVGLSSVLLIAGGLGPDQMTFEILRQAAGWDPGFVLVLHSASGRYTPELLAAARDPALAGRVRLTELQRAGGKRLPVADFLRGFDIKPGMVFS